MDLHRPHCGHIRYTDKCRYCRVAYSKAYYRKKHPVVYRSKEFRECLNCGEIKKHKGLGFCKPCYRRSFHDRQHFSNLKRIVLERDNYKCVDCGITATEYVESAGKGLSAHHIDGDHFHNVIENLVTLCNPCHRKRHTQGKDSYSKEYAKNHAREYYLENRERIRERSREYYYKNKEEINLKRRKHTNLPPSGSAVLNN